MLLLNVGIHLYKSFKVVMQNLPFRNRSVVLTTYAFPRLPCPTFRFQFRPVRPIVVFPRDLDILNLPLSPFHIHVEYPAPVLRLGEVFGHGWVVFPEE